MMILFLYVARMILEMYQVLIGKFIQVVELFKGWIILLEDCRYA